MGQKFQKFENFTKKGQNGNFKIPQKFWGIIF